MEKQVYEVTVYSDGGQEWRQNGKLHRLDGPAVANANGDYQEWYKDGERHRLDGPAYINGEIHSWWVGGKRHRLDGPAYIYLYHQEWYQNGKLHRLDGPAVANTNGDYQEWFIEGKQYTKDEFDQKIKEMNQEENYLIFEGKKYQLVKE